MYLKLSLFILFLSCNNLKIKNKSLKRIVLEEDVETIKVALKELGKKEAKKTINIKKLLHLAIETENIAKIFLLLEEGADINLEDYDSQTPLSKAIFKNNKEIISLLLNNGANLKYPQKVPYLHLAVRRGNEKLIELLLEKGADIEEVDSCDEDKTRWTPLTAAASVGNEKAFEYLLKKGANIDTKISTGWPALHSAAFGGNLKIVNLLLEKGVDINQLNCFSANALHVAIYASNFDVAKLLTEKGIDVNIKNKGGYSPIMDVVRKRQNEDKKKRSLDLLLLLLKNGADINDKTKNKENLLNLALKYEHNKAALFLIDKIDIKERDRKKNTPLHLAAEGKVGVVLKLLEKGAGINQLNCFGETALHIACKVENYEVIKILIKASSFNDLDIRDNGKTALDFVLKDKNEDILSLFKPYLIHKMNSSSRSLRYFLIMSDNDLIVENMINTLSKRIDINKDIKGKSLMNILTDRKNISLIEQLINHKSYHFKDISLVFKNYYKEDKDEKKEILQLAINKLKEYYSNDKTIGKKYSLYNLELAMCRLHSPDIFDYDENIKNDYIELLKAILIYISKATEALSTNDELNNKQRELLDEVTLAVNILIDRNSKAIKVPLDMFNTVIKCFKNKENNKKRKRLD